MFELPPYRPPIYIRNGHLNTIIGNYIKTTADALLGEREIISYQDQNSTSVYVHEYPSNWVVLVFHGLGGSVESDFVSRTVQAGRRHAITTVAVNHRNAGDAHGLSKVPYHSGKGEDISDLVLWARNKFPHKSIATVGYSMSASMILNLRTRRSGTEQPDFALVLNPPVDLHYSAVKLTSGPSKIYGQKFTSELRELIDGLIEKKIVDPKHRIPANANLRDVDEIFTAPLSGFKSSTHYYEVASTISYLEQIKEKTTMIMAQDDPFIRFKQVKRLNLHPQVATHYLKHGGHIGFVSDLQSKWSDQMLAEFFKSLN